MSQSPYSVWVILLKAMVKNTLHWIDTVWLRVSVSVMVEKKTKNPFNNDDIDNMLDNDDAVDADDPLSYNDAIEAGYLFNNDDTVNNDDAVDGSDMFSNDDAISLTVEVDEQPGELPHEIWEQILSHVIFQSDCLWPNHKRKLFCRIRSVNPQFYKIMESLKLTLSHVFLMNECSIKNPAREL